MTRHNVTWCLGVLGDQDMGGENSKDELALEYHELNTIC